MVFYVGALQPLVFGWMLWGLMAAADRYILGRKSRALQGFLVLLLLATLGLYVFRLLHGFPEALRPHM